MISPLLHRYALPSEVSRGLRFVEKFESPLAVAQNRGVVAGTPLIRYKQGARFNGTTDYISYQNDVTFDMTGRSFTVMVRVKTEQTGTTRLILGRTDTIITATNTGYCLYLGNAGTTWHFSIGDGGVSNIALSSNLAPTLDAWYHLSAVWDESVHIARIYVDGDLKNSSGAVPGMGTVDFQTNLLIGASRNGAGFSYWQGSANDARLFPGVALTADEIKNYYRNEV